EVLKAYYESNPDRFRRKPHNPPSPDKYRGYTVDPYKTLTSEALSEWVLPRKLYRRGMGKVSAGSPDLHRVLEP
ncbi:hypothetical protein, partial [Thiohalorhabdus methylotrophus]